MSETIFGKILAGEIPAQRIYEDEHCIAINDINPRAPVHVLIIPKKAIAKLSDARIEDQPLLGHLMLAVTTVATQLGVQQGFRVIINNGEQGGQSVFHLHVHLLAGQVLSEADML